MPGSTSSPRCAPRHPGRRSAARRPGHDRLLELRADDIRLKQAQERSDRLLIFTVDASGSSALARLAEAKGAVELLLAQAYARRDHVALVAFRGAGAEVLLPPTRSLVQTKRRLAGLPGGGGTPLASGLAAAHGTWPAGARPWHDAHRRPADGRPPEHGPRRPAGPTAGRGRCRGDGAPDPSCTACPRWWSIPATARRRGCRRLRAAWTPSSSPAARRLRRLSAALSSALGS